MKHCSIHGCPGEYVKQAINHLVTLGGKPVIIENVPAEVCQVCGDTLLDIETVVAIDTLLTNPGPPLHSVPVYAMPEKTMAA
ncbi:MAG: YgiT-type zinc finger protein [Proteobacteria bacterium]|nr:YgiT-type zinc finger protein [Pseudomonadota bacterium]MBU0966922.1 YgiT-type zinc finger protein [Pseudomonadota bacterium]